ncbi:hypothetical protein PCASD_18720 [Puccinia coronata f. sp. avenae]|uniref:Ribosome maturation protein SDO1/SBDS N-terminal domain-containing protein n=1 Tax=Puccinia coronata f. sp. avenae TaxID=200324 RepID=A0A2N5SST9_9BASI|nr:hypothetical protein PCASD_18720 [Puccinia coronata f. sp. avenae]
MTSSAHHVRSNRKLVSIHHFTNPTPHNPPFNPSPRSVHLYFLSIKSPPNMSPQITKVIYKPDSTSTDEFICIIADAAAYKKWLGGDKTVPLVEIVDSFDVFHTGQGAQGLLIRPSKQELENIFGSSKDDEVVTIVLEKGRLEVSDGHPLKFASKNDARGGNTGARANLLSV